MSPSLTASLLVYNTKNYKAASGTPKGPVTLAGIALACQLLVAVHFLLLVVYAISNKKILNGFLCFIIDIYCACYLSVFEVGW